MRDRSSLEARWKRRRRGKIGEHKVDCTDGRFSIINPTSFKGDALVQLWVDSRVLATLSNWLDKEGNYTRFMSEVIKDSLQRLCEELIEDGEVVMVEDTSEARALLEKKYRINLNPNGRGEKNVLHNMVLSERIKEEVPDKVRELQRRALGVYNTIEVKPVGERSSLFDELEEIEKGGQSNGTAED